MPIFILRREKVREYGIRKTDNYWDCTKGNVGYCLNILLSWALLYPDYKWIVE